MKDDKGDLPIHIALCRKCTAEKLRVLHNAHPQSLFAVNNRGYNPITLASSDSESQMNASLILFLKEKLLDSTSEMSEALSAESMLNTATTAAASKESSHSDSSMKNSVTITNQ